jgi:hypothetical protein
MTDRTGKFTGIMKGPFRQVQGNFFALLIVEKTHSNR